MLGKLLKYELKRSARKFFPLVVGYMIVALIFSLMLRYGESVKSPNFLVIFIVVCIAYGIAVGALFTVGFTISLTNFHKTLFTDEGYLMLTIPVKPYYHIFTKFISSVIWSAASMIVFVLSLLLIDPTEYLDSVGDFINALGKELPETNGYYRNRFGDLAVSARTCLEENYTAAVSLYKSGDIKNAMRVLGRAAHFISDMGCTVHVANMKYQDKANNVHYAFEKHVSTTCTRHTADSFDKRLLKYYGKDNFGEAANKLVKYAGKFVDTISHLDPRAFDDVAKNTLPVTQQNVTALLLKFYDDCTSDAGNYILDGKAYTFKNEISGLVLTVTPKGLQLEKPDKELEQKLTVCLTEDGTFGLKISDGGYVNASCKGYDYLKIDGKPVQFRVTALGKRRFRISTESTGYVKVLANSKGGKLSFADLEPENSAQIWILN